MKIDRQTIQELRDLPIEEVASLLNITVRHHQCLCPYHKDRNPSGYFSRHNRFRCFSCSASADTIGLTMHCQGLTFPDACQWLMKQKGIIQTSALQDKTTPLEGGRERAAGQDTEYLTTFFRHPTLSVEAQDFLFRQRRYSEEVVRWMGISSITEPSPCTRWSMKPYFDAPSLLLPYWSADGRTLQNLQSRYLGKDITKVRFKYPPRSRLGLFNLPVLRYLKEGDELWLAEGPSDTIGRCSDGQKCLGIASATTLREEDIRQLKPYVDNLHLTLCFSADNDSAGKGLEQRLVTLCQQLSLPLRLTSLPDGIKDYSELRLLSSSKKPA